MATCAFPDVTPAVPSCLPRGRGVGPSQVQPLKRPFPKFPQGGVLTKQIGQLDASGRHWAVRAQYTYHEFEYEWARQQPQSQLARYSNVGYPDLARQYALLKATVSRVTDEAVVSAHTLYKYRACWWDTSYAAIFLNSNVTLHPSARISEIFAI